MSPSPEGMASIAGAKWLKSRTLQALLQALSQDGEEARIAGGAVRNELLGKPVTDVDIATTTLPEETARRAEAAGFRAVPTGAEHGTITVVANGKPYEVTTLRDDVETDGRRARVRFGRDWARDAGRRDFTINALYATTRGEVIDLVGGLKDLESGAIRFIGDAESRIREDYLRILRFFRLFAWYGGGRPDAEALMACARLKDGLGRLSVERVWMELKKLLSAPDPSRALLWMRQAGVLARILPEGEKWGIDLIHPLMAAERDLGWPADPLLRLEALLPPAPERVTALAARLKLSTAEQRRLEAWAAQPAIPASTTEAALARMLYEGDRQAVVDRLRLALAVARGSAVADDKAMMEAGSLSQLLAFAEPWERPEFPVKGRDLTVAGFSPGPEMGNALKALEAAWIASGFRLDRHALLERARASASKDSRDRATRQVLFVQGGGKDVHDEWDNELADNLARALGPRYEVRYPRMPDEADPNYGRWKGALLKEIALLDEGAILVGHSIGGTILINLLAERELQRKPAAVFLLATPYVGPGGWPGDDIPPMSGLGARLPQGLPVHLYHGDADDTAPFAHLDLYAKAIPQAVAHPLQGRDHQLGGDMSEVARDIEGLS